MGQIATLAADDNLWYVRLGAVSGDLADKLTVDSLDGDLGVVGDGNLDLVGDGEKDGMGVADVKVELVTLDGGTETDALDFQIAAEAGAHARDHVVDESTGQAVKGADSAVIAAAGEHGAVPLDGKGDFLGKVPAEFPLGALDCDQAVCDGDLDLVRNGDGGFSDTGHG